MLTLTYSITKDQYLRDPCGTCATAFWKNIFFKKPGDVQIVHERDLHTFNEDAFDIVRYFRLIHDLKEIDAPDLPADYYFQTVNIQTQKGTVAHLINRCYENTNITQEQVDKWTKYKVFDNDSWIFIYEASSPYPVALGIADFDDTIKEGCLEWIQTLPGERGKGLGQAIVGELLLRLAPKAKFATVSGKANNKTNPEALYRKCGFNGEDIWCVLTPK
jgi:GNAT superfamily N-acetyltransferase